MGNIFEKSIAEMNPEQLKEIVELSQKEVKRVKDILHSVKFPEPIVVYYLENREVIVDRTEELHIPSVNKELSFSHISTLGEAETLVESFVDSKEAMLHPVVGQKFEMPTMRVWQQIAENFLSSTLPKNFFDQSKSPEKISILESDDV